MVKRERLGVTEWSRRQFIRQLAGTAGGAAILGLPDGAHVVAQRGEDNDNDDQGERKPSPNTFKHVVLVMMENRSFDHLLGWLPEADGKQVGLSYLDRTGKRRHTYQLAPDYQGCGHPDPGHSQADGLAEYNGGACDGWLLAGNNDEYSIGYYTEKDLGFFGTAAPAWTTCDRYFASLMSETYPNRIHQHAAQTDRATNTIDISTLPTIWDRLASQGIEGRYYFGDVPFLALWGLKYLPISRLLPSFIKDCSAGDLPAVSFVDPHFLGEEEGLSDDDHPHGDIRAGEQFLAQIYTAVTTSPAWPDTILIVSFDEWGGFFDHVPPPLAPQPPGDQAVGLGARRGFRVPAVLVSPFAKRGAVSSKIFDHASVLKLIESRWNLEPLTVRDAQATNLGDALDFSKARLQAPRIVPNAIVPIGCSASGAGASTRSDTWSGLLEAARLQGWPV